MHWQQYEAVTKYIYEMLGQQSGVKIEGHGQDCKVLGKSGVEHQIDVLTAHSDGIHTYKTAIECKCWNEKVNKGIVMKLSEIIKDANIHKGVIVSKSGFTEDAITYARNTNIGLVELRVIDETDLKGKSETIDFGIIQVRLRASGRRPEILSAMIDYAEENLQQKEKINIYAAAIKLPDGNLVPFTTYTTMFQNELHHQNKLFQPVTRRYEISGSLINQATKTSAAIKGVVFTGVLKKIDSNTEIQFPLVDRVWLFMKAIFEGTTFQISKNGIIFKTNN